MIGPATSRATGRGFVRRTRRRDRSNAGSDGAGTRLDVKRGARAQFATIVTHYWRGSYRDRASPAVLEHDRRRRPLTGHGDWFVGTGWLAAVPMGVSLRHELVSPVDVGGYLDRMDRGDGTTVFRHEQPCPRAHAPKM